MIPYKLPALIFIKYLPNYERKCKKSLVNENMDVDIGSKN